MNPSLCGRWIVVSLQACALALAAGCGHPTEHTEPQRTLPTAATSPVPTATIPAPVATTPGSAAAPPTSSAVVVPERPWVRPWAGTWSSDACGGRKYVRVITLTDKYTFQADDRVSPCPPNARCVWSGIVTRRGSYRVEGTTALLTEEAPAAKAVGVPLPPKLVWDDAKSAPAETGDGVTCVYTRSQ